MVLTPKNDILAPENAVLSPKFFVKTPDIFYNYLKILYIFINGGIRGLYILYSSYVKKYKDFLFIYLFMYLFYIGTER